MSIDCHITVEDGVRRVQLLRRHAGYPHGTDGVLATLAYAFPYAWPSPRFDAMDFAAAIVRAWKPLGGGEIYIIGTTLKGKAGKGVACFDYIIKPATGALSRTLPYYTGDPVVEVVGYTPRGWLEEVDETGLKLEPSLCVPLSRTGEVGVKLNP